VLVFSVLVLLTSLHSWQSEEARLQSESERRLNSLAEKEAFTQELEARLLTAEAGESSARRELDSASWRLEKQEKEHEQTTADMVVRIDRLRSELSELRVSLFYSGHKSISCFLAHFLRLQGWPWSHCIIFM